jgi:hypothetical protein
MTPFPRLSLIALAAITLAGCGGSNLDQGAGAQPQARLAAKVQSAAAAVTAALVEVTSTPSGMQSIAFHNGAAFVSLYSSEKEGTAVLKSGLPLAKTGWTPVNLGKCALGPVPEFHGARAPTLKQVNGRLWLLQHWEGNTTAEEHSLCEIDEQGAGFVPKDAGLVSCHTTGCETLSATDIKVVRNRFIINGGGGFNVQVSETGGASWRVLTGAFASQACYDPKFEVVGDRLLVGGECPLDSAYLRSYQLTTYTLELVSDKPLPVALPNLENRNIQFIESIAGTNRVFAGVEGGLLRSEDGGKSFQFVIHQPLSEPDVHPVRVGAEPAKYPYIWKILSPAGQPDVIVAAGFDKPNGRPYLVWSADGGDTWTDLSDKLPGYSAAAGGQVTSLVEGPQGQLFISVNEEGTAKGHLMQLTLGKQ